MLSELIPDPSEEDVLKRLTKKELSLHCQRTTRGAEEITRYIQELLEAFTCDQGLDTLGTPLLDKERIWESQKRHVSCIQDPAGFQLYTQTGTLLKGTVRLPTYRCARGSTSLESFHLHLKNFIPGKYSIIFFIYCSVWRLLWKQFEKYVGMWRPQMVSAQTSVHSIDNLM